MSKELKPAGSVLAVGGEEYNAIIANARARQAQEIGKVMAWMFAPAGRFFSFFGRSVREAESMRTLASLDDRTLADLGLSRSDIPAFVMQGAIKRVADEPVAKAEPTVPVPPKSDAQQVEDAEKIAA